MTGAEHYDIAEALLVLVKGTDGLVSDGPEAANTIAAAHVHATLALADAQRRAAEAARKANR